MGPGSPLRVCAWRHATVVECPPLHHPALFRASAAHPIEHLIPVIAAASLALASLFGHALSRHFGSRRSKPWTRTCFCCSALGLNKLHSAVADEVTATRDGRKGRRRQVGKHLCRSCVSVIGQSHVGSGPNSDQSFIVRLASIDTPAVLSFRLVPYGSQPTFVSSPFPSSLDHLELVSFDILPSSIDSLLRKHHSSAPLPWRLCFIYSPHLGSPT